jgi:hypothetical protein
MNPKARSRNMTAFASSGVLMKHRAAETVFVYLYKRIGPQPEFLPQWGTLEAIAQLDRCVAITRSARRVDASLVDADGFLPYDITPDDDAA